jgi:hypothetical protein
MHSFRQTADYPEHPITQPGDPAGRSRLAGARVTLERPQCGLACTEAAASLARSSLSAHYHTGKDIQNGCDIVAPHGSYVF